MGLYTRDALGLLGQLIMRDNPDFKGTINSNTAMVLSGPLTTNLGNSGRNSRITLNGRTGSGIVGKREFFYDRINLGTLFNGITVVFDAEGSSRTYADLLPSLNAQYGIQLVAADLSNGTTKLPYGYKATEVTLNIATTSVVYTGSLKVVWTRKPVGIFPDSGPGTKVLLIGDLQEGYFGVVPESELLTPMNLISKLNEGYDTPVGAALPLAATRSWYKFARDGKIVYLASYNQINIRWQDLYTRGAAYETTVPLSDHYPPVGVTKKVQQLAIQKMEAGREWYLSPCIPRLSADTLWDYAAPNQPPDPTGDVGRLFVKIATGTGLATGEWDNQAIDNTSFWTGTTSKNDPRVAYASNMVGTGQATYDRLTYTGGWRPMLELVDPTTISLPLESFAGTYTGALQKPLVFIEADTGDILLNLSNMEWQIQGNLARPLVSFEHTPLQRLTHLEWLVPAGVKPAVTTIAVDPPSGVQQTTWSKHLRAPVVQIASNYKEVVKVDLAATVGTLIGFN